MAEIQKPTLNWKADNLDREWARFKRNFEPVVHGPRQQPKALLPAIKLKLKEMEEEGFKKKVTEPT